MAIGAFPVAKLAILLLKQISKPIANMLKEQAKNHPFFRRYVCIPPAQIYNWCEVKSKMWMLNLGRPVNIPVLSDEMAIQLGADLLGEAILFLIACTLLLFEYNRQSKKEAVKEAAKKAEMERISSGLAELFLTTNYHDEYLKELDRILYSISGQKPDLPRREVPKSPPSMGPSQGALPKGADDECIVVAPAQETSTESADGSQPSHSGPTRGSSSEPVNDEHSETTQTSRPGASGDMCIEDLKPPQGSSQEPASDECKTPSPPMKELNSKSSGDAC